ncbi:cobalamin (vitamin B12) biosynthesis CbiX protein [Parafrankia sp. EUN1f]|nr:cobalamin (vitamin B12) biosynthesis CbiX protein [Parafrankia sp. EUN1f]
MVIELARALGRGGDPVGEELFHAGTADAGSPDAGTADAGTASAGTASAGTASTAPAWQAVEPAFLDVVHPDIAQGYAALVRAGCSEIIAHPFFLFEGNHTTRDIPAALAAAQAEHPTTRWTITRPLGLHAGVVQAVRARIDDAVGRLGPGYYPGVGRPVTSSPTTAARG